MRKFTETHEWIELTNNLATVGITAHAVSEAGEIVHIELPHTNKDVKAGDVVCVIESTKAAIDITCPISGYITQVNKVLESDLQQINQASEQNGWLFQMKPANPKELDVLLDKAHYEAMIRD